MNACVALDHAAIARLIPHQGAMCLLQRLDHWDAARIVCRAASHRDPANPLRSASGLLSAGAVEYAAQAMALHGALIGRATGSTATPGYLASVRGVQLHRLRLDDLPGDLEIDAVRLAGDARQILYRFSVSHAGTPVADGRATVVLNTPLPAAAGPATAPSGLATPANAHADAGLAVIDLAPSGAATLANVPADAETHVDAGPGAVAAMTDAAPRNR